MALEGFVDEKYLVYEDWVTRQGWEDLPKLHSDVFFEFWSDRYALSLIQYNRHYWNLTIFDLFMNESRQIRFRKSSSQVPNMFSSIKIFLLDNEYGVVVERFDSIYYVSLVRTDWLSGELHLIDQFERECQHLRILMDPLKPTKFMLRSFSGDFSYQICSVVGSKFELSNSRQSKAKCNHYSNGKLINFKRDEQKFLIRSYDWATKQKKITEIDYVPERFEFVRGDGRTAQLLNPVFYCERSYDEIIDGGFHGAAEFSNGNFMAYASNRNDRDDGMIDSEIKIYKIPVQRPNLLRNSVWILLVKIMTRKGKRDPYSAARKFLPLNSDLRSPWFEDTDSDTESSNRQSESESDESNQGSSDEQSESESDQVAGISSKFKRVQF